MNNKECKEILKRYDEGTEEYKSKTLNGAIMANDILSSNRTDTFWTIAFSLLFVYFVAVVVYGIIN